MTVGQTSRVNLATIMNKCFFLPENYFQLLSVIVFSWVKGDFKLFGDYASAGGDELFVLITKKNLKISSFALMMEPAVNNIINECFEKRLFQKMIF